MAEGADSVDPRLAASGDVDWDGEMSSLMTTVGASVSRGDTSVPPQGATFERDEGQVPMRSRPRSRFVRFPAYGLMRVADEVRLAAVVDITDASAPDDLPEAPKVDAPPAPTLSWDDETPAVAADGEGTLERALANRRAGLTSPLDADEDIDLFEATTDDDEQEALSIELPEPSRPEQSRPAAVAHETNNDLGGLKDVLAETLRDEAAAQTPAERPVPEFDDDLEGVLAALDAATAAPVGTVPDAEDVILEVADPDEVSADEGPSTSVAVAQNPHWVPPKERKFAATQWNEQAAATPAEAPAPAPEPAPATAPAEPTPVSTTDRFEAMDALRDLGQVDDIPAAAPTAAPKPAPVPDPQPAPAPEPQMAEEPVAAADPDPTPAAAPAPAPRGPDDMVDRTSLLRELSTLAGLEDL